MRIINKKQFLAMPKGTVFHKYQYCGIYGELNMKIETVGDNDFAYIPLYGYLSGWAGEMLEMQDRYEATGESFEFDIQTSMRDGLFEEHEMYAVYGQHDILNLIDKLMYGFGVSN